MSLWIYLHFPSLQLNALHFDQFQGLVIVEGRKNEIIQLNEIAQVSGIKKGMGLAAAAALCSELQVLEYDRAGEEAKLKEIAHSLYVVTSDISFFEPNGLLLQAGTMLTLYDGLANYWQAIQNQLAHLPFTYSFASAYSPLAARMLARKQLNLITDSQTGLMAEINRCSIEDTELTVKQRSKLARVGIRTIGALLSIPMTDLSKRFDGDLLNYVGRLTGKFHHAVSFYHPPEQFCRSLDLFFEVENLSALEKPLLKLLAQLEAFLRIRDQYAHELSLALQMRDKQGYLVSASSAAGEYRKEAWLQLFQLKFESVKKLRSPAISITLRAERVAAKRGEMADLFEGKQGSLSALELLSVLQAKLGEQAVKGICNTEDPRPHLSSQFCEPLNEVPSKEVSALEKAIPRDQSRLRPSLLLPNPKPLRERITVVHGPERIATGWWDGQSMIRDYFIARAANGSWLWVFRTPEQSWFLHGVFS